MKIEMKSSALSKTQVLEALLAQNVLPIRQQTMVHRALVKEDPTVAARLQTRLEGNRLIAALHPDVQLQLPVGLLRVVLSALESAFFETNVIEGDFETAMDELRTRLLLKAEGAQ